MNHHSRKPKDSPPALSWAEQNGRLLAICEQGGAEAYRAGCARSNNPHERAVPRWQLGIQPADARDAMREAWLRGWDGMAAEAASDELSRSMVR